MFKIQHIREEDYWLFPIVFLNILAGAVTVYASVITFRLPALIVFLLGLWFTSNKIRRDYSSARARIHIGGTILSSLLFALFVHLLTN